MNPSPSEIAIEAAIYARRSEGMCTVIRDNDDELLNLSILPLSGKINPCYDDSIDRAEADRLNRQRAYLLSVRDEKNQHEIIAMSLLHGSKLSNTATANPEHIGYLNELLGEFYDRIDG